LKDKPTFCKILYCVNSFKRGVAYKQFTIGEASKELMISGTCSVPNISSPQAAAFLIQLSLDGIMVKRIIFENTFYPFLYLQELQEVIYVFKLHMCCKHVMFPFQGPYMHMMQGS